MSAKLIADWRAAHPINLTANATAAAPAPAGPPAAKETPLIETISATVDVNDSSYNNKAADADSATGPADAPEGDQTTAESASHAGLSKVANGVANGVHKASGPAAVNAKRAGVGVAPGSFMGLILSIRDKVTGAALPDSTVSTNGLIST